MSSSPANASAETIRPPEANQRAPCLSDSQPDTGPETTNPPVSGSRKMPAHSGVSLKS